MPNRIGFPLPGRSIPGSVLPDRAGADRDAGPSELPPSGANGLLLRAAGRAARRYHRSVRPPGAR
ncbi:MAG: hypothetical protein ACRD1G_11655, partial [Acidimicrobiales bacterium]